MNLYLLQQQMWPGLGFDLFFGLTILGGGWLLARSAFRLRPAERFAVGLGLGLLLDVFFINLLGRILPVAQVFLLAPTLVGAVGLWAARQRGWRRVPSVEWQAAAWQAVAIGGLTVVFWGMQRGMYIQDDYFHLPLLSTLAAGNFPLQFHLNADIRLDYHYALHLLAGGLVRWGGMTVWGAWDGVRSLVIALTLVLGWLWGKRITRRSAGGWMLAFLLAFGSGTRWLLLLVPAGIVQRMGAGLTLWGSSAATGPDLLTNLTRPWAIGGMSPLDVPFAFVNGFWYPVTMAWGGSSSLVIMTLLLLLLVYPRRPLNAAQTVIWVALLAVYALVAEYQFVFLLTGMGVIWVLWGWRYRQRGETHLRVLLRQWAALAAASLLMAGVQGGVLSGLLRGVLSPAAGEAGFGYAGFSVRWPPALVSGHLGPLMLNDPWQVLLAAFEIGPVLWLVPFLLALTWRWLQRSERAHLEAALVLGASIGFILPLFLRYGMERDQARLFSALFVVSLPLAAPRLWLLVERRKGHLHHLFWAGYGMTVFAGLVLFALQLLSAKTPLLSEFITSADARLARQVWNQLPPDALVLDRLPPRGVTVTGRLTRSSVTTYRTLPEWESLMADLDPYRAAAQGFDFIYMDGKWWNDLNARRARFEVDCVRWLYAPDDLFAVQSRWLLDVRECR